VRDIHLQWLNNECRRELIPAECKVVAHRVLERCTFVADWSAVSDMAVRIVPTKAVEMQMIEEFQ